MKEIVRSICSRHPGLLQFAGVLGPGVSLATFVVIEKHRRDLGFGLPAYILLLWFAGGITLCIAGSTFTDEEPVFRRRRYDCLVMLVWSFLIAMPVAAVILWCIGLFDPAVGTSYTIEL